jgi:hypothetical protein
MQTENKSDQYTHTFSRGHGHFPIWKQTLFERVLNSIPDQINVQMFLLTNWTPQSIPNKKFWDGSNRPPPQCSEFTLICKSSLSQKWPYGWPHFRNRYYTLPLVKWAK